MAKSVPDRWRFSLYIEGVGLRDLSWHDALPAARATEAAVLTAQSDGEVVQCEFNTTHAAVLYIGRDGVILRPFFPDRPEAAQDLAPSFGAGSGMEVGDRGEYLARFLQKEEGLCLYEAVLRSPSLPAVLPNSHPEQPHLPFTEQAVADREVGRVLEWRPVLCLPAPPSEKAEVTRSPILKRLSAIWLVVTPLLTGVLAGGLSGGDEILALLIALIVWLAFSTFYWLVVPWALQQWVRPPARESPWNWLEQASNRDSDEFFMEFAALHLVCFGLAYLALTAGRLGGPLAEAGIGGCAGVVLGLAILPVLRRPAFRDLFTLYWSGFLVCLAIVGVVTVIMVVVMAVNVPLRFPPRSSPESDRLLHLWLFLAWMGGTVGAAAGVVGRACQLRMDGHRSVLRLAAMGLLALVLLAGFIAVFYWLVSLPMFGLQRSFK